MDIHECIETEAKEKIFLLSLLTSDQISQRKEDVLYLNGRYERPQAGSLPGYTKRTLR